MATKVIITQQVSFRQDQSYIFCSPLKRKLMGFVFPSLNLTVYVLVKKSVSVISPSPKTLWVTFVPTVKIPEGSSLGIASSDAFCTGALPIFVRYVSSISYKNREGVFSYPFIPRPSLYDRKSSFLALVSATKNSLLSSSRASSFLASRALAAGKIPSESPATKTTSNSSPFAV